MTLARRRNKNSEYIQNIYVIVHVFYWLNKHTRRSRQHLGKMPLKILVESLVPVSGHTIRTLIVTRP